MALTREELATIAEAQLNNRQAQQNIAAAEEAIANAEQNIINAQAEIDLATSQLTDPNLPQDRRVYYEATIAADLRVIASNENVIQVQQDSITANNEVIAINQNIIDNIESGSTATEAAAPVGEEDPFEAARLAAEARQDESPTEADLNVDPLSDEAILAQEQAAEEFRATLRAQEAPNPYPNGTPYDDDGNLNPGWTLDEEGNPVYVGGGFVEPATQESAEESRQAASVLRAQSQQTLSSRVAIPSAADWRVRLSLAKGSTYLYNAAAGGSDAGILQPLYSTNGVVFPYTPSIEVNYAAKYDPYDLVHSNYRGYFYRSSSVGEIQLKGTFTAQDTTEANYLLAVIHFFRSVTKMFYGQDAQAGTPPPLVYLSGFGQNQFNNHSCVVSNFGYSLPTDVDYIRAGAINNIGFNLENRRDQSSGPGLSGSLGTVSRLLNNLLSVGALPGKGPQSNVGQNVNNTTPTNSTYVPTKMEISVTLLPIQTRSQVSKQFSLKGFANGDLLKKGFW